MVDASDTDSPSSPPEPVADSTSSHPVRTTTAHNPSRPIGGSKAYDIRYFFTDLKRPAAEKGAEALPAQKVCKLCM
jgi:hypothetical protein